MFTFINSKVILSTTLRLSPSFIIPIFGNRSEYDIINQKVEDEMPNTGFERVKKIFRKSEFDEVSIELNNVVHMSLCGAFFGACLGGFVKSKDAYFKFMDENQATAFSSTMDAKKKLQTFVTVEFAKGAYYWGWRLSMFSGIFGLFTTIISAYRNDSSIVEYVTAGAITGAIYKANLGPVAMMVGAGVGATLSFFGGLLILGVLKATGRNMDEIRASLFKLKQARVDQYNQAVEKASTEKHDDITRHHDHVVQEKGIVQVEELS